MDRGDWQATVHKVTESWKRLSTHSGTELAHTHARKGNQTAKLVSYFFLYKRLTEHLL